MTLTGMITLAGLSAVALAVSGATPLHGQSDAESDIQAAGASAKSAKPKPDVRDFRYGPHFGNDFDIYLAESDTPTPLVVWLHGGAFLHGSKSGVPSDLLRLCLANGISVASVNYRLSQQAPFPAAFHDAARAIQYLRFDAGRWNIDREKICASGSSAGGGISLWLACTKDLANPDSHDMVARYSSRPNLLACIDTQSSYDPNFMRKFLPKSATDQRAMQMLFRVKVEEQTEPWARERLREGSAIDFVGPHVPPTFLFYRRPDVMPTDNLPGGHAIHHPIFGKLFAKAVKPYGVEVELAGCEEYPDMSYDELRGAYAERAVDFIRRHWPRD